MLSTFINLKHLNILCWKIKLCDVFINGAHILVKSIEKKRLVSLFTEKEQTLLAKYKLFNIAGQQVFLGRHLNRLSPVTYVYAVCPVCPVVKYAKT